MGEIYISEILTCPVHKGQMKYDMPRDLWFCVGYDGEGCDHEVTSEEWHKTLRPIGFIDGDITFNKMNGGDAR